jgi:hypothetical protein
MFTSVCELALKEALAFWFARIKESIMRNLFFVLALLVSAVSAKAQELTFVPGATVVLNQVVDTTADLPDGTHCVVGSGQYWVQTAGGAYVVCPPGKRAALGFFKGEYPSFEKSTVFFNGKSVSSANLPLFGEKGWSFQARLFASEAEYKSFLDKRRSRTAEEKAKDLDELKKQVKEILKTQKLSAEIQEKVLEALEKEEKNDEEPAKE